MNDSSRIELGVQIFNMTTGLDKKGVPKESAFFIPYRNLRMGPLGKHVYILGAIPKESDSVLKY